MLIKLDQHLSLSPEMYFRNRHFLCIQLRRYQADCWFYVYPFNQYNNYCPSHSCNFIWHCQHYFVCIPLWHVPRKVHSGCIQRLVYIDPGNPVMLTNNSQINSSLISPSSSKHWRSIDVSNLTNPLCP